MRKKLDYRKAFEEFCLIFKKHPKLTSLQYDALLIRPCNRRTLEMALNVTWKGLIALAKGGKFPEGIPEPAAPEEEKVDPVKKDFTGDQGYIEVTSQVIRTLDEALGIAKVDLEKWRVERYVVNSWNTTVKVKTEDGEKATTRTNYQVKIWLKAKVIEPLEIALQKLIQEIPKFKVPKIKRRVPRTPFALEMCLYDAHIGKLAWDQETMQGDYDIKIASKAFVDAAATNLNYSANYNLEKIFFILGQDFLHVENYQALTPLGHNVLDVDSRLPKIYFRAKEAVIKAIYLCREVAPVEVLWVPGNHDMHASFYLSEVIKEHFKDDSFVTVDNTPTWRKARLWGDLLVGYTHDANIRMTTVVNMLPQFWPQLWGKSKFREWHTGHKHKKGEWKFMPVLTVGGVLIRQIPTLSTIDAWHYQHGFTDAIPGGESLIWSKKNGIIAHYTAFITGD